jgi:hypothetical protein
VTDGNDFWICDCMETHHGYNKKAKLPPAGAPIIDYGDPRAYWVVDPAAYPPARVHRLEFRLTLAERAVIQSSICAYVRDELRGGDLRMNESEEGL